MLSELVVIVRLLAKLPMTIILIFVANKCSLARVGKKLIVNPNMLTKSTPLYRVVVVT